MRVWGAEQLAEVHETKRWLLIWLSDKAGASSDRSERQDEMKELEHRLLTGSRKAALASRGSAT